ncbi:MAG: TonB-dependent receptor [Bacteroidales bacterium]|nr:TonB-dependent receptor [Bacteroidales bacterium]
MKKKILLFILLVVLLQGASAQSRKTVTVSGYINDVQSGETLIGAGVLLQSDAKVRTGAVTNVYGYYTLTLPKGPVSLQYSYVGYQDIVHSFDLQKDTVINVALTPSEVLKEAMVVAQKDAGIQSTYLGAIEVPLAQIKNTPVVLGEADVLKAIQMMPGVQGGNEGFTGLYVRGGGPDENLVLLDGVPIYNVDHMLGLFSIFQTEAVKKVTLYKGSFPARYGGRVSSIVDIRTNDGNMKETHGNVSLGVVSDKFHIEGPILKDKLSYSFSGRGMHTAIWDPVIRLALKNEDVYANYFFYDLNGKLSYRLSDSDRFFLAAYSGRDKLLVKEDDAGTYHYEDSEGNPLPEYHYTDRTDLGISWGNDVVSLRWNHIFSQKLFANTTLAYNRYRMGMESKTFDETLHEGLKQSNSYDINYRSGIRDWSAKLDFDYVPVPTHLIKFGAEYIHHTFIPENLAYVSATLEYGGVEQNQDFNFGGSNQYDGEDISLYAEDDFSIGTHLTLNPGAHISLFTTNGHTYFSFQPRVSAKYSLDSGLSFKTGYARMAQYVHLLSSAQISLPVDLWVPITDKIKPVTSDQFSAGVYYDHIKGWEFSIEGYYKMMNNILEYKDGTIVFASSGGWEDKVEMGRGRAMGLEFFIQKTAGKATGWLAYTLAKSERQFPDGSINLGEWFPYKYDRRHNFNICLNYEISKVVDVNATWSYSSGGTTTLPVRQTTVVSPDGSVYSADFVQRRNNYRLPSSHRLNVGVNLHRKHRRSEGVWNLSVYNVYNRKNPNFVFVGYDTLNETGETVIRMQKITILPILPSVGYTLNF